MKRILTILVILSLILISVSDNVDAADPVKTVCCDKLENSLKYCVMVEKAQECDVDGDLKSYDIHCNQLNNQNCVKGCCVYEDGNCVADRYKIECIDGGGQWSAGSCEIDSCMEGFCIIGSKDCFFSPTKLMCLLKADEMGVGSSLVNYDVNVKTQEECYDKYKILEKARGCCVSDDGNCLMGSVGETNCFGDGKSFVEKGCSEITICKEKCSENYGCLNGDVYRFGGDIESGCGWEELVKECNELEDEACVKIREKSDILVEEAGEEEFYNWLKAGDYIAGASGSVMGVGCRSVSCEEGDEFYVRNYDVHKEESVRAYIKITSGMLGGINSRKDGESWCIKPKDPNPPGSRHYVYYCNKGVIEVIPCNIGRVGEEGICDEDTVNDFTEAKCVKNRWKKYEPKEKDKSNENAYPPGLKFYSGGQEFGAPSTGESCGRCGGSWYDFDLCHRNECSYAGDCEYSEGAGMVEGCLGGAAVAILGPKIIEWSKMGVGELKGLGGTAKTAEEVGTMGKIWKGTKAVAGFIGTVTSLKAFYEAIKGDSEEEQPKQEYLPIEDM